MLQETPLISRRPSPWDKNYQKKFKPRHAGSNNINITFRRNWDQMVKFGADPVWRNEVAKMHLDGILTDAEADAATFYAEVKGRYDRYHPINDGLQATPRAQSYEFGSRAADSEIERHNRQGTIKSYERRAKRIRKLWEKIQSVVPAYRVDELERVVLFDERPSERRADGIKELLLAIHRKVVHGKATKERTVDKAKRSEILRTRVAKAVETLTCSFGLNNATPKTFQLIAAPMEFGVRVHGLRADGSAISSAIMVTLRRDDLAEHVAALFLKHCERMGWKDHPKS